MIKVIVHSGNFLISIFMYLLTVFLPLCVMNESVFGFMPTRNSLTTNCTRSGYHHFREKLSRIFDEEAYTLTLDKEGNRYVTGITESYDFQIVNGYQSGKRGRSDAFLVKVSRQGVVTYSTFIGGSGEEYGLAVAVDQRGNAYVTGLTTSDDFPVTYNSAKTNFGGVMDAFVVKVDTNLSGPESLRYATLVGGSQSDFATSIAVDSEGAAYIGGRTNSQDFQISETSFQPISKGNGEGFITKLNPAGTQFVYSTFLGGSGSDWILDIKTDAKGAAYVAGTTASTDFPLTSSAAQTRFAGKSDAFVAKINRGGSALSYATFLGSIEYDDGLSLALETENKVNVTCAFGSAKILADESAVQFAGVDKSGAITVTLTIPEQTEAGSVSKRFHSANKKSLR